ncbi:uncharacterized protein [Musca autumnalis]|uniref:uncharacterized protein n=1 Tax=Musca autumnalis TaxID=221902 RepID=UPI003CF7761E
MYKLFKLNYLGLGFILLIVVESISVGNIPTTKPWTYEFKSISTSSSNEDLLKLNFSIERVSRGVYAISGTMDLNYDIVEGDANEVEGRSYRSDNGVNPYKPLAFQTERHHMFSGLNKEYKEMLMPALSRCSDMPVFEDKFQPPLEKKVYTLTKCQLDQDEFPQYMSDGFYKGVILGWGTVNYTITFIAQVETLK